MCVGKILSLKTLYVYRYLRGTYSAFSYFRQYCLLQLHIFKLNKSSKLRLAFVSKRCEPKAHASELSFFYSSLIVKERGYP